MKFEKMEDFDNIDFTEYEMDDGCMDRIQQNFKTLFTDLHFVDDKLKEKLPNLTENERMNAILIAYNHGFKRGIIMGQNSIRPRKKFLGIF